MTDNVKVSALTPTLALVPTDLFYVVTDNDTTPASKNITADNINLSFAHQSLIGAGVKTHSDIDSHIGSTSNPHSVTASQVGLGNVTNDAQLKRAAADYSAFSLKAAPSTADLLLIEDAADSAAKKYAPLGSLSHTLFADIGTNTHAQIDSALSRLANTSGTNTGDQDLSGKVTANVAISGDTKTKITYDAKGLVTSGADATTADIADSTDKRYCTDAQKTVIGNTSGTNTGDQDLSGYVPTSRTVNSHALSSNVTVSASDVGLGSVENTALSTWAGTSNISNLAANLKKSVFGISIDGGGSAPAAGSKGFVTLPYSGTISKWYITGDVASGIVEVDLKKSGTSVIGASGNKPAFSGAQRANAAPLSWTSAAISANDEFEFYLDSCTTTTRINLSLFLDRT